MVNILESTEETVGPSSYSIERASPRKRAGTTRGVIFPINDATSLLLRSSNRCILIEYLVRVVHRAAHWGDT